MSLIANSSAFVVATFSGSQRAPSFKGPPALSFSVTTGEQFGQREHTDTPRRVFFWISDETIRL